MTSSDTDLESRLHHVTGFASLAKFIASDRDKTTLIFQRFDELAARNLLYLQSELAELHAQQQRLDAEDVMADMKTKQFARNYADFEKAAGDGGDPKQKERMDLVLKIRGTLKEYRESLIFESTLATIPIPSKRVLKAFQNEFHNKTDGMGEPFPTLGGCSANIYERVDDLVALKVEDGKDRLNSFAQGYLAFLFPDKKRSRRGIAYASYRAIGTFVAWLSTSLAALLLIGAIVILYKVRDPDWRLGLIAVFTCLFAGSVGVLTNARRAELFAATAGYAAVLVVFVSGDLGNA